VCGNGAERAQSCIDPNAEFQLFV